MVCGLFEFDSRCFLGFYFFSYFQPRFGVVRWSHHVFFPAPPGFARHDPRDGDSSPHSLFTFHSFLELSRNDHSALLCIHRGTSGSLAQAPHPAHRHSHLSTSTQPKPHSLYCTDCNPSTRFRVFCLDPSYGPFISLSHSLFLEYPLYGYDIGVGVSLSMESRVLAAKLV